MTTGFVKRWDSIDPSGFSKEYLGFLENVEAAKKDPNLALEYATEVVRGRFPEGEQAILDAYLNCRSHAVEYARTILKGRWLEFESLVIQNLNAPHPQSYAMAEIVLEYVVNIDLPNGIREEFEPLLAKYPSIAFNYALLVLKRDFPQGEPAMATSVPTLYRYATEVLKGKLPRNLHRIMLADGVKNS